MISLDISRSDVLILVSEKLSASLRHVFKPCTGRMSVSSYFGLLKAAMIESHLTDKSGHVYIMDELGLRIINKEGKVVATKCAKEVYRYNAGETLTVVACYKAERNSTCLYL